MAKATIYRVGQLSAYIKNIFDNDYALRDISVRGEVSNCKYSGQGHIYFTLKDETSTISSAMFKGKTFSGLKFKLEDGQKIIVNGSVNIYEVAGRYQLYASEIILDGVGDLHKMYEDTKKRLDEMGMFSPEYKKPIPSFAKKIGIVTASTGAAIQDIINISTRRNPYVQLYLYPAIVQGEMAATTIVRGIETLDKMGLDTIIVGRGGGSIEDLWAFNEEVVARAIFDADTPIISAVGHETDTTIADFVSDLRAPTPSAAAELAVFDAYEYLRNIETIKNRLNANITTKINAERLTLDAARHKLYARNPKSVLANQKEQLSTMTEKLNRYNPRYSLDKYRDTLAIMCERLTGFSPLEKLSSGFSYVKDSSGHAVKSTQAISVGDDISIHVTDGIINSKVTDITKGER